MPSSSRKWWTMVDNGGQWWTMVDNGGQYTEIKAREAPQKYQQAQNQKIGKAGFLPT